LLVLILTHSAPTRWHVFTGTCRRSVITV